MSWYIRYRNEFTGFDGIIRADSIVSAEEASPSGDMIRVRLISGQEVVTSTYDLDGLSREIGAEVKGENAA